MFGFNKKDMLALSAGLLAGDDWQSGIGKGFGYMMQQRNQPNAKRRIVKGVDGHQYYADTQERVLPGVKAPPPKKTTPWWITDTGKVDPRYINAKKEIAQAGRQVTNINLPSNKGETEFQKRLGKNLAGRIAKDAEQGETARMNQQRVQQMRELLKGQGGLWTGVKGLAADWGINLAGDAGDLQAANAIATQMMLDYAKQLSGAKSNFEVQKLLKAAPRLINSPEGNEILLNTLEAANQYQMDLAELAHMAESGVMKRGEYAKARRDLLKRSDPLAAFKKWQKEQGRPNNKFKAQAQQPNAQKQTYPIGTIAKNPNTGVRMRWDGKKWTRVK